MTMRHLFVMIMCVVVLLMTVLPASYAGEGDGTFPKELSLPSISMPYMPYTFSGPTYRSIVQDQYCTGSIWVTGYFADGRNANGFPFALVNISGSVRKPFSDCAIGYRGFVSVWYGDGFSPGLLYMPGGSSPYLNFGWVNAYWKYPRSDIHQWWLQTDPRWANNPYGRNGISTIRAYGCCATCAAMQLKLWGWEVDPGSVVAAMSSYKDGFTGKSGLRFNWERLQKIYGCGYHRGKPIQEMLDRGMTTQSGVRHDSDGIAGHWILPRANANRMGSYIVWDTMGRGVVDTEIPRYDDPRDDGCWETDTRSVYRKYYDFNLLLQQLTGHGVQNPVMNAVAITSTVGPVKVDTEEYLKQNLGKIAPCLLYKQDMEAKKAEFATVTASSSSSTTAQVIASGGGGGTGKETPPTLPGEDDLVNWEYWGATGYLAYAQSGDVHLRLMQGSTVVAQEQEEANENQETDEVVTDLVLEVNALKGGVYTLEITGTPGTAFEVQTFQYIQNSYDPVDVLISGTIGDGGVYSRSFTHASTALLTDVLGLQYIPEGSPFIMVNANVTARIATGQYAVQSQYSLQFPVRMTYTGAGTLQEFGKYQLRGIVGPNRTITVDAVANTSSTVNCVPVFRNNRQVFDPVAGYLYTKISGKVTEVGADYFVLDNIVRVKMADPISLIIGMNVSLCGVPVNGEFVANTGTIVQY